MVLRQHDEADREDAGGGDRRRGGARPRHHIQSGESNACEVRCVSFCAGEEAVDVEAQVVLHGTGGGGLHEVEQVGLVPGRRGVGDDQRADHCPCRKTGADMR